MLRDALRYLATYLLPARAVPVGDPPRTPEGLPGGEPAPALAPTPAASLDPTPTPGVDVQDLLRRAEELERVNARLRELEAQQAGFEERVKQRAEELLLEIVPADYTSAGGPPAGPHPTDDPGFRAPRATSGGPPDDELPPDQRMSRDFERVIERQDNLERMLFNERVDQAIAHAQQSYPHMDQARVKMFLDGLAPEQVARVNIAKLCEISHNKELRRLEGYAEQYHLGKLKEMQAGPNPPPLPGRGAAAPAEQVRPTRATASKTLGELLRAKLGWSG